MIILNLIFDMLSNDEKGQGLIEYVLLIAFIAMIAYAGFLVFGSSISNAYQEIIDNL